LVNAPKTHLLGIAHEIIAAAGFDSQPALPKHTTMKMIMAIVQPDDALRTSQMLNEAGFRVTRMATQGAWLRRENVTLLVGVNDDQVAEALKVLRQTAQRRMTYVNVPGEMTGAYSPQPLEVEVGGATIFVLDVERFERLS
jgi:uncharacterized protein YaaQ